MEHGNRIEPEDSALIKGYLAGDAGSFDVLYKRYRRQLYAYLNNLFSDNRSHVDDIFQQTWLKAIDRMEQYEDRQMFLAWLMRIAHNLAIDCCRKLKRNAQVEVRTEPEQNEPPEAPDTKNTPARELDGKELGEALNEAVGTLTPELREVFLMRMDEVPFKEIASVQKCSINTALARMQYAVKKLRKILKEWKQE